MSIVEEIAKLQQGEIPDHLREQMRQQKEFLEDMIRRGATPPAKDEYKVPLGQRFSASDLRR